MSTGPNARALPTAYARVHLHAHAEFVAHALRMRKANAESRVPFWDPDVFLGHRIARRLMRLPGSADGLPARTPAGEGAHLEIDTLGLAEIARAELADAAPAEGGSAATALRAARAWDDAAFDDEPRIRRITALLAWSALPSVVVVPRERLAGAWERPWTLPVPVDAVRALGPAGYYLALGPGVATTGLQDDQLDHWLEGCFLCLDEHRGAQATSVDLDVVLLHYDMRGGVHDTVGCIPLHAALPLGQARQERLTEALAADRRAPALAALASTTAMRVLALLLDVLPEVNYLSASRRLAWSAVGRGQRESSW